MIDQRVAFDCGEDAGRNSQAYRQSQGNKSEQERRGHTLDNERQGRRAMKKGLPKVPLHRTPDERAILHEQWPVEPERLAQGGTVRFGGLWENHRHGITREMEQQKGDERNAEAHHQEPHQPA